jgi:HAD superfamily hydrolase (TIGR01509 family)
VYWNEHVGLSDNACVRLASEAARHRLEEDALDRLLARKNELYRAAIAGGVELVPGFKAFVASAREAGLRLAVVSGSRREEIDELLETHGLSDAFALIVAAGDTLEGKPDPACFLLAAHRLGVAPGNCVVIEDSRPGILAARGAGMSCVALATSHDAARLSIADAVWNDYAGHGPADLPARD